MSERPSETLRWLLETKAPRAMSEKEANELVDYVAGESSIFPAKLRPFGAEVEIPATVDRIESIAGADLPAWARELLDAATEDQRREFLSWLEEVQDRAYG